VSALAALTTAQAILIGIGAGLAVLVIGAGLVAGARRPRRAPGPDIPSGMQPGPSDADLEKPVLEKLLIWGTVLVVFMALWIPVVFLREPSINAADTEQEKEASIERGRLTSMPGSEANPLGFNCQRCHGPDVGGGQNVFNGNVVDVPNLQTVCGGEAFGHAQIKSLQDVIDTIAQGRAGTDMPSWSVQFAGAMDDQQINDLVNYLLSIQKVPSNENICIKAPAAGT
jgi:mono/diheme cytochrome c family protein